MTTTPRPTRLSPRAHPFAGAARKPPTRRHRPAVWECMLGTVSASDGHESRYFDYDWDGARAFALDGRLADELDLRVAKPRSNPLADHVTPAGAVGPSVGQSVLWVLR